MEKPNKIVTSAFILAILFGAYNIFFSSSSPKNSHSDLKTNQMSERPLATRLSLSPPPLVDNPEKERRKGELGWGRNPFLFPGVNPYKKEATEGEKKVNAKPLLISLKVTSILISGEQRVATIDQPPFVVSIGDRIEDNRVVGIESDRIVLNINDKKCVFRIE
ncbi:MAG: hypothetical protein V1872_00385 [bacterium]